jgi:hypothetical protein
MEILSNSNPIKKTKFNPSESEEESNEFLESNQHLHNFYRRKIEA